MKKIICLLFVLLAMPVILLAQTAYEPSLKAKESLKDAKRYFYEKNYKKAVASAEKAKQEDPKYPEPYQLLGSIYNMLGKRTEELNEFQELLKIDPDNYVGLLNLGTISYNNGQFKEALGYYEKFLTSPSIPTATKDIITARTKKIKLSLVILNEPVPFDPLNAGPGINTRLNEYFPTLTVDGETMYFTRRKVKDSDKANEMLSMNPNFFNEDILVSHKVDGKWQKAVDVSELNTPDNEGAMCIAPDGSYMILTACNRPDGLGSCDLYISFYKNNTWSKPVNMGEPVNSRNFETQPTISFDGRTIYFASQRPGGFGGIDIYSSTRDDSWNFSKPVNLGPAINTPENEQSPFIHPDDQTLYFCSKGHIGLGNNDIFFSRRNAGGGFDSAINIGYPINTTGDESGLVVDRLGENAYYATSTGKSSFGGLDIYSFKVPEKARPKPVTYLKGKVYDNESKATLAANFELVDLLTGKTIIKSITSDDGQFLVPVPGGRDYLVNVSAKGYLFYSDNIPLKEYKKADPFLKDIPLPPIKAGQKIALRNIFFKTDAYILLDESASELDRLIKFLKANPALNIEISGHTDNTGNPVHNKDLSLNRAKSVFTYLVNKGGILSSRLHFTGYGETQPIASNTTEEGKAQNRRTEVKVIQ
jgi:outer membrane protein OmpA-like peptidoglycan-associated protein/tetratricopeptide (TPR) repeat protein